MSDVISRLEQNIPGEKKRDHRKSQQLATGAAEPSSGQTLYNEIY